MSGLSLLKVWSTHQSVEGTQTQSHGTVLDVWDLGPPQASDSESARGSPRDLGAHSSLGSTAPKTPPISAMYLPHTPHFDHQKASHVWAFAGFRKTQHIVNQRTSVLGTF